MLQHVGQRCLSKVLSPALLSMRLKTNTATNGFLSIRFASTQAHSPSVRSNNRPQISRKDTRVDRAGPRPPRTPERASVATLGVDRDDKTLLRDIIECTRPADVLAHYVENKSDYDFVATGTALATMLKLSKTVSAWKRLPLNKFQLDELVNDSIEKLGASIDSLGKLLGPDASKVGAPASSPLGQAHQLRAVVNTAFSLAKLNRLPTSFCDHVSSVVAVCLQFNHSPC
jgi:hypothetical protein